MDMHEARVMAALNEQPRKQLTIAELIDSTGDNPAHVRRAVKPSPTAASSPRPPADAPRPGR